MRKTTIVSLALVFAFALGACSPSIFTGSSTPTSNPTATPIPPATFTPVSEATPTPAALSEPAQAVQAYLASLLDLPPNQIILKDIQPTVWSDACLGAPRSEEVCAEVIVPGFIVIFTTPSGDFTFHTDQTGAQFRPAPSTPLPGQSPLVVWERSGGLAGVCQNLAIYLEGMYVLQDCKSGMILKEGMLPEGHLTYLAGLAGRYGSFEWKYKPPEKTADMFVDHYTFTGRGAEQPTAERQQEINDYLAMLFAELVATGPAEGGASGIEGQALIGPTCPGPVSNATECADQPYQATIVVLNESGQPVTQFTTGEDGRFRIPLPPGTYTLHPLTEGRYPIAADQVVTVTAGQYTQVVIAFDSGIR